MDCKVRGVSDGPAADATICWSSINIRGVPGGGSAAATGPEPFGKTLPPVLPPILPYSVLSTGIGEKSGSPLGAIKLDDDSAGLIEATEFPVWLADLASPTEVHPEKSA